MREISLSGGRAVGKVAIVDDEDFARLSCYRWFMKNNGYAYRSVQVKRKKRSLYLHREVLGVSHLGRKVAVDHANGDKLDCRRSNLRLANASQNGCNRGVPANNKSGVKGVSPSSKKPGWWHAHICVGGKQKNLGDHRTIDAAAAAYRRAAESFHGVFARFK